MQTPSPCMQTPLPLHADPSPLVMWSVMHPVKPTAPLDADHMTCDACWEAEVSPLVDRMIDMCENITLPLTLFAGGNKDFYTAWNYFGGTE